MSYDWQFSTVLTFWTQLQVKIKEGDAPSGQVYITCLTVSMYSEPAPPSKRQDHGHDANITEMESCLPCSAQLRITVSTRLQVNKMTCPPQRYWPQWWGPKLACSFAMVARFSSCWDENIEPLRFLWDAVPRPICSVDLSASNKVVKHIGCRVGKTWTQHCILLSSSLAVVTKLHCTCLLSIKRIEVSWYGLNSTGLMSKWENTHSLTHSSSTSILLIFQSGKKKYSVGRPSYAL